MINKFIYSVFFLIASLGYSFAQDNVTAQFKANVEAANYKGVTELCSDFVEIETDKYEETTSKGQVSFILKDFFVKHPPKKFTYNHVGVSPGGAKYAIAFYESLDGMTFLVVVKFKVHGTKLLVDTIKFTPE